MSSPCGNRLDDFRFVLLAHVAEKAHRFVARHDAALDLDVALRDFRHALFDRGEVFRRERPLVGEVVIEAVLDHRADRHLRVGKELLHRVREQMRGGVADDLEPVGILVGDDRDVGVGLDAMSGVDELAVDAAGERRLGETGPDRRRDLGHGDRMIKRTDRAVGQLDVRHKGLRCFLLRTPQGIKNSALRRYFK